MEYMKELPEVFSLTEEYRGLGDGLSPEMKAIREAVEAIPAEYLPGSAEELLPRWEKILGLKGAGNLSERRFSVLSRLAGLRPYTIARLRQQLSAAMGEGKFTAEVDPENFLLRVEVEGRVGASSFGDEPGIEKNDPVQHRTGDGGGRKRRNGRFSGGGHGGHRPAADQCP